MTYDVTKINVSLLTNCKSNFRSEQYNFKSKTYGTFKNGYINNCSDSYMKTIANDLNNIYSKIEANYETIYSFFDSYINNVNALENSLLSNSSSNYITESVLKNFVSSKLSDLPTNSVVIRNTVDKFVSNNFYNLNKNSTVDPRNKQKEQLANLKRRTEDEIPSLNTSQKIEQDFINSVSQSVSKISNSTNKITDNFSNLKNDSAVDPRSKQKEQLANLKRRTEDEIPSLNTSQKIEQDFINSVSQSVSKISNSTNKITDNFSNLKNDSAVDPRSKQKEQLANLKRRTEDEIPSLGTINSAGEDFLFKYSQSDTGATMINAGVAVVKGADSSFTKLKCGAKTFKHWVTYGEGDGTLWYYLSQVAYSQGDYEQANKFYNIYVDKNTETQKFLSELVKEKQKLQNRYEKFYNSLAGKTIDAYSKLKTNGKIYNFIENTGETGTTAVLGKLFGFGMVGGFVNAGEQSMDAAAYGANLDQVYTASALGGTWGAFSWKVGSGINNYNPFSNSLANSAMRVGMDSVFGGVEPFVQTGIASTYMDDDYWDIFKANGGWSSVGTGVLLGAFLSALGEAGQYYVAKKKQNGISNQSEFKLESDNLEKNYSNLKKLYDSGQYNEIAKLFENRGYTPERIEYMFNTMNSEELIGTLQSYNNMKKLYDSGQYNEIAKLFEKKGYTPEKIEHMFNNMDLEQLTDILQGNRYACKKYYEFMDYDQYKYIDNSIAEKIEKMLKNDSDDYIYGIHRTQKLDVAKTIYDEGLYLTGHVSSGVSNEHWFDLNELERNITFDKNIDSFMFHICGASSYKNLDNMGYGMVIKIPKKNLDDMRSLLYYISDENQYVLKPEYVVAKIEVKNGNVYRSNNTEFKNDNFNNNINSKIKVGSKKISDIMKTSDFNKKNLIEGIVEEIPSDLSIKEKARIVYLKLNQAVSYSDEYFANERKNNPYYVTENVDSIKTSWYDKTYDISDMSTNKVVCSSWSRIYKELLEKVGVPSDKIKIHGIKEGSNTSHNYVSIDLGKGKKIYADGTYTRGSLPDLVSSKYNMETRMWVITKKNKNLGASDIYTEYTNPSNRKAVQKIDEKIGYKVGKYKTEFDYINEVYKVSKSVNIEDKINAFCKIYDNYYSSIDNLKLYSNSVSKIFGKDTKVQYYNIDEVNNALAIEFNIGNNKKGYLVKINDSKFEYYDDIKKIVNNRNPIIEFGGLDE